MDRYITKKVMASILVVYLHIISPYIRRFRKFSYPLEVAVAFK